MNFGFWHSWELKGETAATGCQDQSNWMAERGVWDY